jgi:hypothetical protein
LFFWKNERFLICPLPDFKDPCYASGKNIIYFSFAVVEIPKQEMDSGKEDTQTRI